MVGVGVKVAVGGTQLVVPVVLPQVPVAVRVSVPYTPVTVTGVLWYNIFATNDAIARLGGQPFDNKTRLYHGSDNDLRLNLGVQRAAADPAALAEVAHFVGHVDRVLVLGSDDLRTALEREIVAIGHAPETIREAPVEGPVDREALLARLRRLA